jgi:Spy/CpxP family protein refolding chaperone
MVDRWADELGLDAEARSRLEALAESGRAEQDRLREQLRGEQEALRGLLMVPTPDEAAVMRQADTIGALETRAQKARLRTLLAVRASLTPEQRERLSALHAERRARFEQTLQEGCGEEIAQHCADAPAGPGRMLCLREHRDALSATCSDALRSLRHEWRRGRGEGRRGGRGPGSERGGPPPPR